MPPLPQLDQHRADLSAALLSLNQAGLGNWPAAHMCRRYLAKVKCWLDDPRGADVMLAIYAPGIRDALKDAEFELRRVAPVEVLGDGRVLA
jgi:hypothetical protein